MHCCYSISVYIQIFHIHIHRNIHICSYIYTYILCIYIYIYRFVYFVSFVVPRGLGTHVTSLKRKKKKKEEEERKPLFAHRAYLLYPRHFLCSEVYLCIRGVRVDTRVYLQSKQPTQSANASDPASPRARSFAFIQGFALESVSRSGFAPRFSRFTRRLPH